MKNGEIVADVDTSVSDEKTHLFVYVIKGEKGAINRTTLSEKNIKT